MKNKNNIVVLGLAGLFGLIGLIMSIVAITQKYSITDSMTGQTNSISIKEFFDNLDHIANTTVKANVNMAYIGSIVTIVLSIGLLIFGGIIAFMVFKKDYEAKTAVISIATILSVIVMGLAIGAIVTSNHVTDLKWMAKHGF